MGRRNVTSGNGDEACEAHFRRQQIVKNSVEAIIGDTVADRESFSRRIEEPKVHRVEHRLRELDRVEGGEPTIQRLQQNGRDSR